MAEENEEELVAELDDELALGEDDPLLVEDVIDEGVPDVLDEDDVADVLELEPDSAKPLKVKSEGEDEEDDEDEEEDEEDVEAALDTILKERLAADEDEEEDEDEDDKVIIVSTEKRSEKEKNADEYTCTLCFLLIRESQLGPSGHRVCPSGEDEHDCPAIAHFGA